MLYEMCHTILSAPDIKAIGKSRGFSETEIASRSLFEHVYLSSIGVEKMLQSLTPPEVAALHLLRLHDQAVDITFFSRLYGGESAGYGTFTQQNKPIYDAVHRNLVRKGVLLIGLVRTTSPTRSRMELWRYRFPGEFAPSLPPLLRPAMVAAGTGTAAADGLREELRRLVRGDPAGLRRLPRVEPADLRQHRAVRIGPHGLLLEGNPFTVAGIAAWRLAAWEAAIDKAVRTGASEAGSRYVMSGVYSDYDLGEEPYFIPRPVPALRSAFAQLTPDAWAAPEQLDVLMDILYAGAPRPSTDTMCSTGWESGCLVRCDKAGTAYYRPAEATSHPAVVEPDTYLRAVKGNILVDVERIPYDALELVDRVADLSIERESLLATPSLAKLAQHWDEVHDHPLLRYLQERGSAFGPAIEQLETAWGRLNVHENLLVARITDLSLRVALKQALSTERTVAEQPIFVSDEYVAFPRARLPEVERLVKKAGHVIKTVRAT
jgi:hypothetical protein